jgi:ubiquitin-like protein Pup
MTVLRAAARAAASPSAGDTGRGRAATVAGDAKERRRWLSGTARRPSVTRPTSSTSPRPQRSAEGPGLAAKGEKLKKSLNDILKEIDEALEENAEQFVKHYVQRGGE